MQFLFLLRLHHLFSILLAGLQPPCANQDCQTTHDDTGVVHVCNLNRHNVGEGEEDNRKCKPTHRHNVNNWPDRWTHMKYTPVHVPPSGKQVGENREHIGNVVDSDSGSQKGVECSR
jgi:hypothetical protein